MITKKFYYIDLTKVNPDQLADIFKDYLFVPCVEGTFCYEFDLLEDEVPDAFLRERRANADLYNDLSTLPTMTGRDFMPLGFNNDQLPSGAKMIEVDK